MNHNQTTEPAHDLCVKESDRSRVTHPPKTISPPKTRLFHYTSATPAARIVRSGEIKQATQLLQNRERPVVWLSSHPLFEPTALKGIMEGGQPKRLESIQELAAHETPFRFEVDPDEFPLGWFAFVNLSGCPRKVSRSLAEIAKAWGSNVSGWRISFEPVPFERCLGLEVWFGEWKPVTARVVGEKVKLEYVNAH